MTHASFELFHDRSYGTWLEHTQEDMAMIWHDDEAVEKERVEVLDTVQCFNGFPGMTGIGEDRRAISRVRCNKHGSIILNRVISNCTHRADGTVFLLGQARMPGLGNSIAL